MSRIQETTLQENPECQEMVMHKKYPFWNREVKIWSPIESKKDVEERWSSMQQKPNSIQRILYKQKAT